MKKLDFGPGDIIQKFKLCRVGPNFFPVGKLSVCVEVLTFPSGHGYTAFKTIENVLDATFACSCCWRLYKPDPSKSKTVENEKLLEDIE